MTPACILLYVDPGSGSYLIQVIIAAVLGALFYFKSLWWRIKTFFYKSKKEDVEGEDTSK
jgi:TRAP-type uncharacterized transport system fused permease subunit